MDLETFLPAEKQKSGLSFYFDDFLHSPALSLITFLFKELIEALSV